jgi:hypothetical protein
LGAGIGMAMPVGEDGDNWREMTEAEELPLKTVDDFQKAILALRQGQVACSTAVTSQGWLIAGVQKVQIPSFFVIKPKEVDRETMEKDMEKFLEKCYADGLVIADNPYERPWRVWLRNPKKWSEIKRKWDESGTQLIAILASPSNVEHQEYQCRTLCKNLKFAAKIGRVPIDQQLREAWPFKKNIVWDQLDDWSICSTAEHNREVLCQVFHDHHQLSQTVRFSKNALQRANIGVGQFKTAWDNMNGLYVTTFEACDHMEVVGKLRMPQNKGNGKSKSLGKDSGKASRYGMHGGKSGGKSGK